MTQAPTDPNPTPPTGPSPGAEPGLDAAQQSLSDALRVSDYMEFGEVMAKDALNRTESCGGHFREESATEDGEAKRKDDEFSYVAAWEYKGEDTEPEMHKEQLEFEFVELTQRSYK